MTEEEWLNSPDPFEMMNSIRGKITSNTEFNHHMRLKPASRTPPDFARRELSDRKARLYAVASCRTLWALMTEAASRKAVEVSELFADKKVAKASLHAARKKLNAPTRAKLRARASNPPVWAGAWDAAHDALRIGAWDAAIHCQFAAHVTLNTDDGDACLCQLLRDIFGNPFRPVTIDPRWLTSTVIDLADAIYTERAFDRMPILADALMDAGCDSEEIINHCRGPGPHVRGCWVVDLLLGKE